MLRMIYSRYMPRALFVVIGFLLTLALTCAIQSTSAPSLLDSAEGTDPAGPGLSITIGAGLQGTGSQGSALDVKHGTENGQVVQWNGSTNTLGRYCGDPSQRFCFIEEFQYFLTNCTTWGAWALGSASGAGADCGLAAVDGHPGVANMTTGTTGTGYSRFLQVTPQYYFGGNFGEYCATELVNVLELSTSVNRHIVRIGFQNHTTGANSTNAVQAVYDSAANGDFWALQNCRAGGGGGCNTVVCDGSGGTTAAPVQALTWVTLTQCVNAAGTSSSLKVNGTQCGTNALKIPLASAAEYTGFGAQHVNSSGSAPADVNFELDYAVVTIPFSVAR